MKSVIQKVSLFLLIGVFVTCSANAADTPNTDDTLSPQNSIPAPAFTARLLQGDQTLSLDQLQGQWVLLDFWASWCGPCLRSLPELQQLQDSLGDKGFTVLAISVDQKIENARQFVADMNLGYPLAYDESARIAEQYAVKAMPMSYIIDPRGRVRKGYAGYRSGDHLRIAAELTELMAQAGY